MMGKGMEYIRYVNGKDCHALSPQIDQDLTGYKFFCGDLPHIKGMVDVELLIESSTVSIHCLFVMRQVECIINYHAIDVPQGAY